MLVSPSCDFFLRLLALVCRFLLSQLEETTLHIAAKTTSVEVVSLLLDRGADVEAMDKVS
jgi:ankyrin repeat protein